MVGQEKTKKRSTKGRDLLRLLLTLVMLVLLNYIGSTIFTRFDLTSEKRFTLSDATIDQVENLEDVITVHVYLDGDLPANYLRLRNAMKEMLDEFAAYSDNNIIYEFHNPSESENPKENEKMYRDLTKRGLTYTNVPIRRADGYSEQILFPGATFTYRDREIPMQILQSKIGVSDEVKINNSIQQLEYQISSTIKKLIRPRRELIGVLQGHSEADFLALGDIITTLNEFYTVDTLSINGRLNALKNLDALIVAGPDSAFDEKDKFIIDQFIMRGGKLLWAIEHAHVDADSLRANATTMGFPSSTNLEDLLFKYGVRVNSDLLMDIQALPIPVVTGMVGDQPRTELFPWPYAPLLMASSKHPVVKSLSPIQTEYVCSIDTIEGRTNIRKTPLLTTSKQTKVVRTPTRVSLNILRSAPDPRQYSKGEKTAAILLEGEFESVFTNRVPPQIKNNPDIAFKDGSIPTKMIVLSDAEIIKNPVDRRNNQIFPLGYDRHTNTEFGNKDFILNCVNYLLDDEGLIEVRAKEFKIRLLDKKKAQEDRTRWQVLNVAVPIMLVLLFGIIQHYVRQNRYQRATSRTKKG